MAKKVTAEKRVFKSVDEFEQEYLPKLWQRKMTEAEGEQGTAFARRLTASIFDNIKKELIK